MKTTLLKLGAAHCYLCPLLKQTSITKFITPKHLHGTIKRYDELRFENNCDGNQTFRICPFQINFERPATLRLILKRDNNCLLKSIDQYENSIPFQINNRTGFEATAQDNYSSYSKEILYHRESKSGFKPTYWFQTNGTVLVG